MPGKSELKEVDESPHVSARPRPIFFSPSVFVPPSMNFRSMSPLQGDFVSCLRVIEGDK
jgi:hypothetical protein